MKYRRLGRSGLNVSVLILGSMNFGDATPKDEAFKIIDAAIDEGVNVIDCADIYANGESERIIGEALKSNGKRKDVFITSKVFLRSGPGPNDLGNSKHHIIESCNNSLKRLKTDYIDIYFLHRTDFNIPQDEPLEALSLLFNQGKVRYIGCSTHPAWRTVEALMISEKYRYPKFVCEEPPYNLLDRRIENEIVPMCKAYDLGLITWSPLAQGMLAGNYSSVREFPPGSRASRNKVYAERITEQGISISNKVAERAREHRISTAQFAVSWVLHQPGITGTIIGPRTFQHLQDLLPSVNITLDKEDLQYCDSLVSPGGYVSNHFNTSLWMR